MVDVQDVKDTFYQVLRDRVAAGNPARTMVVRGTVRPGVLVSENELPGASIDGIAVMEAFCLRWIALRVDTQGALPMAVLTCEIRYASDGSAGAAGMDRGRALAAMDVELAQALQMPAQCSAEFSVTEAVSGAAVSAMTGTAIFWGSPVYGPAGMKGERMERTATIEVFGYGS